MNKKELQKKLDQANLLADKELKKAQALAMEIANHLGDNDDLNSQFASLCIRVDLHPQAIDAYKNCLETEPDNPVFLCHLGFAQARCNQITSARENLLKCIELDNKNWLALLELGTISLNRGNVQQSLEYLEKAYALKPGNLALNQNLANAYFLTGHTDKGLKLAQKALQMDPRNALTLNSLGIAHTNIGEMDEAIKYLEKAVKYKPNFGEAYYNLVKAKQFSEKDRRFIEKTENSLEQSLSVQDRYNIEFSVAEMYEDLQEWDKSFDHFKKANSLANNYQASDDIDYKNTLTFIKKYFGKMDMPNTDQTRNSDIPVFIVGMPRSGTTLMEQIIASHSQGAGAGELALINKFVLDHIDLKSPVKSAKDFSEIIDKAEIDAFYRDYLEQLTADYPHAAKVCDKMPRNFIFLGLIQRIFPKAKIIHMTRSPVDICLSCYFQAFNNQPWSFDIDKIAEYYAFYRDVMGHWKSVLNDDVIIDVQYEKLIVDPENTARKAIEFIGLDWEPGCLEYHQQKANIKTASLWQVRQPMYSSSVNRWERYGDNVTPFFNKLYDYIEQDEIERAKSKGLAIKKPGLLSKLFG